MANFTTREEKLIEVATTALCQGLSVGISRHESRDVVLAATDLKRSREVLVEAHRRADLYRQAAK